MNLNQVTILSKDVSISAEFYKKLGLKLIVDALPKYVRFECSKGNSTFPIHETDLETLNSTIIYFEVEAINEEFKKLTDKGINFISKPELKSWLWTEMSCLDPNGNTIIIYHAGENRLNPPWRVN